MNYTKLQKIVASFLLFLTFLNLSVNLSDLGFRVFAADENYYDLVSLVVEEGVYNELKDKVDRYSKDISTNLENTKVVILPVPRGVSVHEVASMNEALYFEGYKGLRGVNFESRLVGTVFIGDIPVPEVHYKGSFLRSVVPYTDFEDKLFVYDDEKKHYVKNTQNSAEMSPEIWHGFILPNTGDAGNNIKELRDFFDKDHDFYAGEGKYKNTDFSLSGNKGEVVSDKYKPYVFYFDQKRENKSLNLDMFRGYELYLQNKEDILYSRYTSGLAKQLKESLTEQGEATLAQLAKNIDPNFEEIDAGETDIYKTMPDIQSRHIINKSVRKFLQSFAAGGIGEMRKNVFNAGRYNYGTSVNMDFIPYLVSTLDAVNDEILKEINTELENEVDKIVKKGLSRKIIIPTEFSSKFSGERDGGSSEYHNYLFGTKYSNITQAKDCSFYRGSFEDEGQLVQANRAFNINKIDVDDIKLRNVRDERACFGNLESGNSLMGLWGKNSPFYMDAQNTGNEGITLAGDTVVQSAIFPLYDPATGKKIERKILNKSMVPHPFMCFDNNLLLHSRFEDVGDYFDRGDIEEVYRLGNHSIGSSGSSTSRWTCTTENTFANPNIPYFFDHFVEDSSELQRSIGECEIKKVLLDGKLVQKVEYEESCSGVADDDGGRGCDCDSGWLTKTYNYKTIDSFVEHKSPTAQELRSQINLKIAPNLPIDKQRYIDFVHQAGEYSKFDYLNLFSVVPKNSPNVSYGEVKEMLKASLDAKTQELGAIVKKDSFVSSGQDVYSTALLFSNKKLFDFENNTKDIKDIEYVKQQVSTGIYPTTGLDFESYLQGKGKKRITIQGEEKEVSYYDLVAFALYWDSLKSVPAKYAFVFENYLNEAGTDEFSFILPKNKNNYEIAYLGAEGNSANMFVSVNPDNKKGNPFGDIVTKNAQLQALLTGANVGAGEKESPFKCAPPDGVPLTEWIPAVMCWLKETMNTQIKIKPGNCGESLLGKDRVCHLEEKGIDVVGKTCEEGALTKDEQEALLTCSVDIDKNGIADCLQDVKNIKLQSDANTYHFHSHIPISADIFDKENQKASYVNNLSVQYRIIKVEAKNDPARSLLSTNAKVIFDITDPEKNTPELYKDYVQFADLDIPMTYGRASYALRSKNKEVNIYLQARSQVKGPDGSTVLDLESNILKIEVRGDALFASAQVFDGKELKVSSHIQANDSENIYLFDSTATQREDLLNLLQQKRVTDALVISLSKKKQDKTRQPLEYPITVEVVDVNDTIIQEQTIADKTDLIELRPISLAGEYTVVVKDAKKYIAKKKILVTAGDIASSDVVLGSSLMGTNGKMTSHITLLDRLGNVVQGENYDVRMRLEGEGATFINTNTNNLNISVFEGYKIFQIASKGQTGTVRLVTEVYDRDGKKLAQTSNTIQILSGIQAQVQVSDVQVGGEKGTIDMRFTDAQGNVLTGLNSRVYTSIPKQYASIEKPYVEVTNGVARIEFTTKTMAGKDIPVSFQVEGLNEVISKNISIFPDKPMKVDLVVVNPKIEASVESSTRLNIELRDRYNNLVFTDSDHSFTIETSDGGSFIQVPNSPTSIENGQAVTELRATGMPGLSHLKVTVEPSLENNVFEIIDKNASVEVAGVSQASTSIETFYFWNKEKIAKKNYNSIYTTLLGANYGDIAQKDYLAGALVFDKKSRALAVTSTLNPQSGAQPSVLIKKSGAIQSLTVKNNLLQDIEYTPYFSGNNFEIDVFNAALNQKLGRLRYAFPDNTELGFCGEDCSFPKKTAVLGKVLDDNYNFYLADGRLHFVDNKGSYYFSVNKDGSMTRKGNIDFQVDTDFTGDYLLLKIIKGKSQVGELAIRFEGANIQTTSDAKGDIKNNIQFTSFNNQYTTQSYSSGEQAGIRILYSDIFSDNSARVVDIGTNGYENFDKKAGLGWKDDNVTLLQFAAGATVGEAVKNNPSISVINIGDPVIALKKVKKDFNGTTTKKQFDSTLGKQVVQRDNVLDYKIFDYNADEKQDILIIKRDKYLELLENVDAGGEFLSRGNLVHISEMGSYENIHTGDFSGKNYDSIFYVDKQGQPVLLINNEKDFRKLSLTNKFRLQGKIVRSQVFDMDADGVDDIVTLEDSGEINIYYASGSIGNPVFQKKNIAKGYAINLSEKPQTDNGLVYFDGLYQVDEQSDARSTLVKNAIHRAKIQNAIQTKTDIDTTGDIDKSVVENLIFEQIAYTNTKAPTQIVDIGSRSSEVVPLTTFIKSQYAASSGLQVQKVFTDVNGKYLSSGDEVSVTVTLKNTSNATLNNIVYLERVEDFLTVVPGSLSNTKNLEMIEGLSGYHFGVDGFSLRPNETMVISYRTTTKNIKYSYVKAGFFESGESGDDKYGDIVLQDTKNNCGKSVDIFRSTGVRSYALGDQKITCDETELPQALQDADAVTSMLDEPEKLKDYIQDKFQTDMKDIDNDGIPDDEDMFITADGSLTITLGGLEDKINEGLDSVENVVNGMSCGFNNGACIATPLNWAPLAPGGDPTFMGKPIGDGLNVGEGTPLFSALTGRQATCGDKPCCMPSVYPAHSSMYIPGAAICPPLGAGGRKGIDAPQNYVRVFATPTLTGGFGTAVCFGATARVAAYKNMPGIAPLFPGGNCIVTAKPLLGCSNDGSNGDPSSLGVVQANTDFGFINGNCPPSEQAASEKMGITNSYVKKYLDSQGGFLGVQQFKEAVEDHSQYNGEPLVTLGGKNGKKVTITVDDVAEADFSDIKKVVNTRVSAFPSFLMGWMTAQIEEIVTKLTDFPTLFIILPDFSGIYDSDLSWKENRDNWLKNSGNDKIDSAFSVDGKFSSYPQTAGISEQANRVDSGIKEAYEFIGSLPLIKIEEEPLHINIPWISKEEIDRKQAQWKGQIQQYKNELARAKADWTANGLVEQEIADKIEFKINGFISSLEKNVEVLESYKKIPEDIKELINSKEKYLDQIMCNVEAYSQMTSGWLSDNGKRFKAWVELYILIKAILKSWQQLIDIFVDYEAECKECKNERGDLLDHQFKLADMIVPKFPIVKFPKWPDIILDLHNIRAGVTVTLPTFEVRSDPLVLPDLPNLRLPDTPGLNIDINLPEFEILEPFELPELPDLKSLPVIELPDLPPPPKLPKLFSGFSIATDIVKLVTKAMCILKMSPFVPEWRAGDQIAFLTERNGFQSFDFFNTEMPQFSLPFLDSIEVTTYVNLEYDTDFIIELAKQITTPINEFTADIGNGYNDAVGGYNDKKSEIEQKNRELNNKVPSNINVDIDVNIDKKKGDIIEGEIRADEKKIGMKDQVQLLAVANLINWQNKLKEDQGISLEAADFKKLVFSSLSQEHIATNPKLASLQNIWKEVDAYTFSKEDKIINDLQLENTKKFETLKSILRREIDFTKKQKQEYQEWFDSGRMKVSKNDIEDYNTAFAPFADSTFQKMDAFYKGESEYEDQVEIAVRGVDESLQIAKNSIEKPTSVGKQLAQVQNSSIVPGVISTSGQNLQNNSCSASGNNSGSKYVYEGIYILEGKKSYRLFDYIDGLTGKEEAKTVDIDNDGDNDFLYMYGDRIYIKTNLSKKKQKLYLGEVATVISVDTNPFIGKRFIPAPADVSENAIANGVINVGFSAIPGVSNYRFSYVNKVDKHFYGDKIGEPVGEKQTIVDGIADIDGISLELENEVFITYKNVVTLERIGNFKNIQITTKKLNPIKEDIRNGNIVFLSPGTKLYTGNALLDFEYLLEGTEEVQTARVAPNSHIKLKNAIRIVAIFQGEGYVAGSETVVYNNEDIRQLRGLPLLVESTISFTGSSSELARDSYVELRYYDDTLLPLNFNDVQSYRLYDLGPESRSYLFSLSQANDYYYGIVEGFARSLLGTRGKQVLLAPQQESDTNEPQLDMHTLKVPVYQKREIDITDNIFEDGGIGSIRSVFIDYDLEKDNDDNGSASDDNDSKDMENIDIQLKDGRILLLLGPFNSIISKKVSVNITDLNGNTGYKEVDFEIYAPNPEISSYTDATIFGILDEPLESEPINMYRYRAGGLQELRTGKNNTKVFTGAEGTFDFNKQNKGSGLVITDKGKFVANIDEKTGNIDISDVMKEQYTIDITARTADNFPKMLLKDNNGQVVFQQILRLDTNAEIFINASDASKKGMYVTVLDSKHSYYTVPNTVPYNGGAICMYTDSTAKTCQVTILKDGRLKLEPGYSLTYKGGSEYISLIIEKDKKQIATIQYRIEADYILK